MNAHRLAQAAQAWRSRLGARVVFDLSAAEAAIRQAYSASSLREPGQVLWVKGPAEAAEAIAFIEVPPRKLRWAARGIIVLGAAAWAGLAIAIDETPPPVLSIAATATWSAVLAGLGLMLGGGRRLPAPPGAFVPQRGGHQRNLLFLGGMIFIVLAGHAFTLLVSGGLPSEPVGRGAGVALAALVGSLPGVLFRLRIRSTYEHLPRHLLDLSPSASVARRLERARAGASAPYPRAAADPRAH